MLNHNHGPVLDSFLYTASDCLANLQSFKRKVWRVQLAYLHNACTFKSESVFSIVNHRWKAQKILMLQTLSHTPARQKKNFCRGYCLFLCQSCNAIAKALQIWKSTQGVRERLVATTKMLSTLKRLVVDKRCWKSKRRKASVEFHTFVRVWQVILCSDERRWT